MTADAEKVALAAILDGLTLIQGQLDALSERQDEIMNRLDTIDAGLAGVTDIQPVLELILARAIEDRDRIGAGFEKTARIAAYAHAAASGSPAPLPDDVMGDPLLARFIQEMPADRRSSVRALAKWREEAARADNAVLAVLLTKQYTASPTETASEAALRLRLAAITREELDRRHVALPQPPDNVVAADTSDAAKEQRAKDLAYLWNSGPTPHLYAEAELAGAVDCLAHVEADSSNDREAVDGMHAAIGEAIAKGHSVALRRIDPFNDRGAPAIDGRER